MLLWPSPYISAQSAPIPEIRHRALRPTTRFPTSLWIWAGDRGSIAAVSTGSETIQNAPDAVALDPIEALRHERRVSAALREVGVALGTTFDLDDLLELILSKLTELVEADRATLYLLDEANKELVSRLVVGDKVRSIRMKLGHGIPGMVAQTGKSIRIRDAYADPQFERDWDVLTGYRTKSMLVAPLKNHLGRTIGVIQVLNKKCGQEFTSDDESILSALSTQAAVAIDNSRLFLSLIQKNKQLLDTTDQLQRKLQDLSLLFELERRTARATTLEELSLAVLGQCAAACEARGAALLLSEEDSGDLVEYLFDSRNPSELRRIGVKSREGFLGAVMAEQDILSLRDADSDPRWSANIEGSFGFPVTSVLAVPLEGESSPLGAIGLFSHENGGTFDDADTSLLRLVSANVSTAVRLFNANRSRERSQRLTSIGRLLSQVIHDFKSPMSVISGYAQLMADADDRKVRAEYSEEILKQFDLLTAMQREVLEFARGEKTVFVRKVYLNKFFADVRRQLALEISGKPIELLFHVDTKLVARFDEGRIARVLHNLARNAIEAMGEAGGVLTIGARMDGQELLIWVQDTGPGIPAAIEGQLFQSFVTMGKAGGTGLGLAIVKKIVEEHGGSVSVSSSSAGATFEIRLPQPVSEAAPVATKKAGLPRKGSTRPSKGTSVKSPPR
jgi:signal transduction histidine kinase/putative methionine-R-sulfoxide reductase with GAF domain